MAKVYNPSSFMHQLTPQMKTWVQNLHQTLTGSVDMGVTMGNAPSSAGVNAGVFTAFGKGNGSGILVRVAATAGTGASYVWPVAGGLVINHGLQRQPIGFHVVDSDKDVRVFRTAPPDMNQITVEPTDRTASVTLYVF